MSIKEEFKSGLYAGVGFMLKGKEKVEEAAREFVKNNKLAAEDGEKFVNEMVHKANDTKQDLEKFVTDTVNDVMRKIPTVSKEDYDKLKKDYEEMKKTLDEIKSKVNN